MKSRIKILRDGDTDKIAEEGPLERKQDEVIGLVAEDIKGNPREEVALVVAKHVGIREN